MVGQTGPSEEGLVLLSQSSTPETAGRVPVGDEGLVGVAGWNIQTGSDDVRLGTLLGPEGIPGRFRVSFLAAAGSDRLTHPWWVWWWSTRTGCVVVC